jgi:hypothetical protein
MDFVFFREELKKAFDQGYSFALFELKAKGIIDEHYNNDSKSSEDCGNKTDATPVDLQC